MPLAIALFSKAAEEFLLKIQVLSIHLHIWPFLDFSNLWGDNCQRWNVITYSVRGAWSISRLIKTQRSHSLVSWVSYNKQTSVKFLITSGHQLHYHRSKAVHCLFLKNIILLFKRFNDQGSFWSWIYESVQCIFFDESCWSNTLTYYWYSKQCNISKS